MPLELSVPYTDKDQVKSLGGFWTPKRKTWVVPDLIAEINPFKRWIPYQDGCIVRKPYLICLSKTNCWKCGKETPMVALGAVNYFAFENSSWVKITEPSLFSKVLALDDHIAGRLKQNFPFLKPTYSRTLQITYYGNTCISCGNLQGDFFHHAEPGGAFFPDPFNNSRTNIILKNIDLGYDYYTNASFGGMAYDDIFFPENKALLAKHGVRVHILKS